MSSTLQIYNGTATISGSNKDFTLERTDGTPWGPSPAALTEGDYFVFGYTGEVATQLLEHLEFIIQSAGVANKFTTAAVTIDPSTGLVSINLGAPGDIVWTDTDLRDLLGFEGVTTTGGSAYTAAEACRYLWRPSLPIASYPGDLTRWWGQRSTTRAGVSTDGTTYSNQGSILYDGIYGYQLLPVADVITTSTTTWETLEQFWQDCIHTGKPVRVLPDRTDVTSTGYVTALITNTDGKVGGFHDATVGRWKEQYNGKWGGQFMMRKYLV
jgi:hypothetical protein